MTYAALPTLRTPRLTLRPLTTEDADAIAHGIGNFDVSKWLAVVPYPYSRADAEVFIGKVLAQDEPFWAICDDEGLQGVICIDEELAYWLARPVWGRGYGFEAAHAVVSHWFSDPKAGNLASGYFDGNDRSGQLLRALGFCLQERRSRHAMSFGQDVISNVMTLTRENWLARQGVRLETDRLVLRPLERKDAAGLARLARPDVARNMTTIPRAMTIQDAEAFIAAHPYRGLPDIYVAIEKDGRYVGGVGVGGRPLNIGYMLEPDLWGQGLMTEALSVFLPVLFDRFPINTLTAEHFEDNPASGALLRKFGFEETGRGMGTSKARLEPAPVITYAVRRDRVRVPL